MQRLNQRVIASHYARTHAVRTITQGAEAWPANERIRIAANATTVELQTGIQAGYQMNWQNVPGAQVTAAQVGNFVTYMLLASQNSVNIKTNSVPWRNFYHAAAGRALTYIDNAGNAMLAPVQDTVPCFDCGLVVPLANIHVDHQRPWGGNWLEAVCKVFRAVGLTVGHATGPKGIAADAAYRAGIGGVAAGLVAPTRHQKYTLNNIGKIYYTLADFAGAVADNTIANQSINHMSNLRPLCNACNTVNRNVQYY
jgi:hypothetical protein